MKDALPTRRQFLAASAATAAWLATPAQEADVFHTTLHKALIVDHVTEAVLAPMKEAGFEGVESRDICTEEQAAKRDRSPRALACGFTQ